MNRLLNKCFNRSSILACIAITLQVCVTAKVARAVERSAKEAAAILEVSQALKQNRSLLTEVQYKLRLSTTRTVAGMKLFATNDEFTRIDQPDKEVVLNQEFVRLTDGTRESTTSRSFDSDGKPIAMPVNYAWNGSIGKFLDPNSSTARLEKERRIENAEDFPENLISAFVGVPIEEYIRDAGDKAAVIIATDGIVTISCPIHNTGLSMVYEFDPSVGYLPRRSTLYNPNKLVMRDITVDHFSQHLIENHAFYFPQEYKVVCSLEEKTATPPKAVPFLIIKAAVSNFDMQPKSPAEAYDVTFPSKANVYDEFSGHFLSNDDPSQLKGQIDEQVDKLKSANLPK